MKLTFLLLLSVCSFTLLKAQPYLSNETYTYDELIKRYEQLDQQNKYAKLIEVGPSDIGKPIHLFILSKDGEFTSEAAKNSGKSIVFINNGIHAGEACGIDASIELAKELLITDELGKLLDSVIVLIVPIYNVGGMLNRGPYSRANQNGPKEHGFRGNAKNLDLNRDFIKVDSRNAATFIKVFRDWDPDIFIDTHTTNGSDHQYSLTLIATQKDKLNPLLSHYMQAEMLPALYEQMKQKNREMSPYVYVMNQSPDQGIGTFLETPRFSSGYAALFDCYSFITEAHALKEFKERVEHSRAFLEVMIRFAADNSARLKLIRKKAKKASIEQQKFALKWELDTSKKNELNFKGYEVKKEVSEVTGNEINFYNREKPFEKKIPYYQNFQSTIEITKPAYYIIPQAYSKVMERMKWNKVEYDQLKSDTIIEVNVYYIKSYKSPNNPYEGHFLHSNIEVEKKKESLEFHKGDYIVSTNQEAVRYIISSLEPQSVDGFFAWNFFDNVLQQKEWFSVYAFEPKAKKILENDLELKKDFEEKKTADPEFAKDNWKQMYFIYKRSPYFEKTVNRYPVVRLE